MSVEFLPSILIPQNVFLFWLFVFIRILFVKMSWNDIYVFVYTISYAFRILYILSIMVSIGKSVSCDMNFLMW